MLSARRILSQLFNHFKLIIMQFFKKITLFCAFLCAFSQSSFAQVFSSDEIVIAPSLSIDVEGKVSTVKEGERIVLKAKGNDNLSLAQWQVSTDNKTWYDIPKANGNIFESMPLTHNSYFRMVSRPLDAENTVKVEVTSNVQFISLESNVASSKRK
jgi:hypothetical protein